MSGNQLSWVIRGLSVLLFFLAQSLADQPGLSTPTLALLLLVLGIPHGAADHLIFQARHPELERRARQWRFFGFYLLLVLGYGLLWYALPLVAFLLFLGLSVHHFGQSYGEGSPGSRLSWGLYVLLFPILLHYEAAQPIIERMIGRSLPIPATYLLGCCASLLLLNVVQPLLDLHRSCPNQQQTARRLLDLSLLTALYLSTDLLLGFALFFLLWHSLPAAAAQWTYLRQRALVENFRAYVLQLLPLTLGALLSLGGLYLWVGQGDGVGVDLGLVFILVSLITLPHAFLVDAVYR